MVVRYNVAIEKLNDKGSGDWLVIEGVMSEARARYIDQGTHESQWAMNS